MSDREKPEVRSLTPSVTVRRKHGEGTITFDGSKVVVSGGSFDLPEPVKVPAVYAAVIAEHYHAMTKEWNAATVGAMKAVGL